ncbi:MAG: hypothetical protein PHE67_11520 [Campylobacterales bacterium]|nr:hypothetical protein [Campylobacterales bacterium]
MNENLATISISKSCENEHRLFLECKACANFEMIEITKETKDVRITCARCKRLIMAGSDTVKSAWLTSIYELPNN